MPAVRWQTDLESAQSDSRMSLLIEAVKAGDTAAIEAFAAEGGDLNVATKGGTTPLMVASRLGQVGVVRLLLDLGAAINETRSDGLNALAFAVFFGHEDVVRELLGRGADIYATNRAGTSADMWAAARGFPNIAELLKQSKERFPLLISSKNLEDDPADFAKSSAEPKVSKPLQSNLPQIRGILPQENSIAPSLRDTSGGPVRAGQKTRRIEDIESALADFEHPVNRDRPFSPFSALSERIREGWRRAAVVVLIILVVSGVATVAALRGIKRMPQLTPHEMTKAKSIPPTAPSTLQSQPVSDSAAQTESSLNSSVETKPAEVTPQPVSNGAGLPNVIRDEASQPGTENIERAPEKQGLGRTQYTRAGRAFFRKNRQQNRDVIDSSREAASGANEPAAVTVVAKQPTPSSPTVKSPNNAQLSPLQGTSTKRKVIQWP